MPSKLVIDTNVAVKWYIPNSSDPLSDRAKNILLSSEVYAPEWIFAEFYQALWKYWNSKVISDDEFGEFVKQFACLPVKTCRVTNHQLDNALEISLHTGGTIYDCLFLATAIRLKTVLITSDRKFIRKIQQTPYAKYIVDLADWPGGVADA